MTRLPLAERNEWRCGNSDCQAVLGVMRPAAGGGKYLDLVRATAVRAVPGELGKWVIACTCGCETTWRGEAVNWRRKAA